MNKKTFATISFAALTALANPIFADNKDNKPQPDMHNQTQKNDTTVDHNKESNSTEHGNRDIPQPEDGPIELTEEQLEDFKIITPNTITPDVN